MHLEDDGCYEPVCEGGSLAEFHFGASVAAFATRRACKPPYLLVGKAGQTGYGHWKCVGSDLFSTIALTLAPRAQEEGLYIRLQT